MIAGTIIIYFIGVFITRMIQIKFYNIIELKSDDIFILVFWPFTLSMLCFISLWFLIIMYPFEFMFDTLPKKLVGKKSVEVSDEL